VLIARPPGVDEAFPNTIVAGADGSPCSAVAVAVARHLSERFDAPLLVVLGSRGMHGVRALGSVSERVAHRAASSVLVVKGPTGG
jgi:nucleotide-binding universal stress UspA family protein